MTLNLQVAGYDKQTERLSIAHPIPAALFETARKLAHVASDDDGEGAYPLEPTAARMLGREMAADLDLELYDWFVEPRRED